MSRRADPGSALGPMGRPDRVAESLLGEDRLAPSGEKRSTVSTGVSERISQIAPSPKATATGCTFCFFEAEKTCSTSCPVLDSIGTCRPNSQPAPAPQCPRSDWRTPRPYKCVARLVDQQHKPSPALNLLTWPRRMGTKILHSCPQRKAFLSHALSSRGNAYLIPPANAALLIGQLRRELEVIGVIQLSGQQLIALNCCPVESVFIARMMRHIRST